MQCASITHPIIATVDASSSIIASFADISFAVSSSEEDSESERSSDTSSSESERPAKNSSRSRPNKIFGLKYPGANGFVD